MLLLAARNLTAADSDGTSDPYAMLFVGSSEDAAQTSSTVSSELNPVWEDQAFSFADVAQGESVTVRVFDYDYIGSDDPLGEVRVPVEAAVRQFLASGSEGQWFRLEGEEAGSGEVQLGFAFESVPSELRERLASAPAAAEAVASTPAPRLQSQCSQSLLVSMAASSRTVPSLFLVCSTSLTTRRVVFAKKPQLAPSST